MEHVTDLLDLHHDFARVLDEIRMAMMDGDRPAAEERLAWLQRALTEHADTEETLLFPHYQGADYPPNGAPEVLERDHVLLKRHLAIDLAQADEVAIADQLALFAGALEHHDLRESNYFKPLTDARMTHAQRREVLDVFEKQVAALPPRPTAPISRNRPTFDASGHPLHDARRALTQGHTDRHWIEAIPCQHPKARRLKQRALNHLANGDRLEAYDALRLLSLFPGIAD